MEDLAADKDSDNKDFNTPSKKGKGKAKKKKKSATRMELEQNIPDKEVEISETVADLLATVQRKRYLLYLLPTLQQNICTNSQLKTLQV